MSRPARSAGLSWLDIVRLGLVQTALGSIIVLTTSTLNRVMVVELSLAATVPGMLVGLHYAVQILRPLWGHGSDKGGRRTAWIVGGLALLALAGTGAAASTLLFEQGFWLGLSAALVCFVLIGFGIGAAGTSLLALVAAQAAPARRPAAATIIWMMMIAGIAITAIISGQFIDPYSHERLIAVTAIAGLIAFLIAGTAVLGIERDRDSLAALGHDETRPPPVSFTRSLADTWADPRARLFTIFVFLSMLAYSTQDLVLEPFGGLLFGMEPGETTTLSGKQHGGVFLGMALVGILGTVLARRKPSILKLFVITGCLGSGLALGLLTLGAAAAPDWPLEANIIALGFANGAFAVAAVGAMMSLAGQGGPGREGIRMGLWGAAQAIAFGLGGFLGTVVLDVARRVTGDVAFSFGIVFSAEAALFVLAALLASRISLRPEAPTSSEDAVTDTPHGQRLSRPLPLQPAE
ncbi:MAG: BCD family MFS transporter [Pseudomonadota bacterium]